MSQWNHISTTKPWKGSKLQFTTKINPRKGTRRFQSSPPHYLRTCLSWKVPVEHKALVVLYPSSCPLASPNNNNNNNNNNNPSNNIILEHRKTQHEKQKFNFIIIDIEIFSNIFYKVTY